MDEGISGTNMKKREEFNRMIADYRAGKIDRIIMKAGIFPGTVPGKSGSGLKWASIR